MIRIQNNKLAVYEISDFDGQIWDSINKSGRAVKVDIFNLVIKANPAVVRKSECELNQNFFWWKVWSISKNVDIKSLLAIS